MDENERMNSPRVGQGSIEQTTRTLFCHVFVLLLRCEIDGPTL